MPRVVLLIPTSTYRAPDFVAAADALGVEVVIASDRRQALAAEMGDRALVVPFDDPEEAARRIVDLGRSGRPLDAVVPIDEPGVLPAALAATRLDLPHNPPEAVALTRDKARMREALEGAFLPQPAFRVVPEDGDVAAAAAEVGLPCVVKPVGLSASRGVMRADTADEAVAAAARIRGMLGESEEAGEGTGDPHGPLLVEANVEGAEVAVEGLLRDGQLEVLAVFDKPEPMEGPVFAETILVTPSRLPGSFQAAATAVAAAAVSVLGLRDGPVHAELRVRPTGEPVFLEVAARSIGGLCSRALRFTSGMTLEEVILRHAARLPLDDTTRESAAAGVCMLYPPRSGVLRLIRGQDSATSVPGVVGLELTMSPGNEVRGLPESARYLGFLFARGEEPGEVVAALQEARSRLHVVVEDA